MASIVGIRRTFAETLSLEFFWQTREKAAETMKLLKFTRITARESGDDYELRCIMS